MPIQHPVKRKKPEPGLLPSILFATAITAAAIAWAAYTVDPPQTALLQTNIESQ